MAVVRICSIEGCGKPSAKKAMCIMHYTRVRNHGNPDVLGKGGLSQKFYDEVCRVFAGDECLTWPYNTNNKGYASMGRGGKGVTTVVSRKLCADEHGPPPTERHEAAHSCGNGHLACVNRNHLSWKSKSGNQLDRADHGTDARGAKSYRARLTEEQVRYIRSPQRLETDAELAGMLGITPAGVYNAKVGKSWAWLE